MPLAHCTFLSAVSGVKKKLQFQLTVTIPKSDKIQWPSKLEKKRSRNHSIVSKLEEKDPKKLCAREMPDFENGAKNANGILGIICAEFMLIYQFPLLVAPFENNERNMNSV